GPADDEEEGGGAAPHPRGGGAAPAGPKPNPPPPGGQLPPLELLGDLAPEGVVAHPRVADACDQDLRHRRAHAGPASSTSPARKKSRRPLSRITSAIGSSSTTTPR